MDGFVKVGKVGDVTRGKMKLLEVGDEFILLVNVGGDLYATQELCSHAEVSLADGILEGQEMECYLPGSRFNVKTRKVVQEPAMEPLKRYRVRVEGDDVLVGPG